MTFRLLQGVMLMNKTKKLWTDAAVLTAGALLLRCGGLLFQVMLAERLEAEGLGLFQLILSVQALAMALATSGIRYVVTRLVSEELGMDRPGGAVTILRRCFLLALVFSVSAGFLLTLLAGPASRALICDERAAASLKILAFSLPFCSLTSVMGGYFTAVRRTYLSAAVQVFEQAAALAFTFFLFPASAAGRGAAEACRVVCLASVLADASAFAVSAAVYVIDRRRTGTHGRPYPTRRIFLFGAPIAVTAWARTALSTLKHLLIPAALRSSGASSARALAAYGTVQGMTFPVLAFPSALFYSLAEVLIPELTEAQVRGDRARVSGEVTRALRISFVIAVCIAGVFLGYGRQIGIALYGSGEAGSYIRVLSPYVILMYMDAVTDGMLKGLGEQLYSMAVNLADAVLSLAAVHFIVPVFAVRGYLAIIFLSELFNFSLSLLRLVKKADIGIRFAELFIPPLCAVGGISFSSLLLHLAGLGLSSAPLSLSAHILLACGIYLLLMLILSHARRDGQKKSPARRT